jgi:hypothetical protein
MELTGISERFFVGFIGSLSLWPTAHPGALSRGSVVGPSCPSIGHGAWSKEKIESAEPFQLRERGVSCLVDFGPKNDDKWTEP